MLKSVGNYFYYYTPRTAKHTETSHITLKTKARLISGPIKRNNIKVKIQGPRIFSWNRPIVGYCKRDDEFWDF